MKLNLFRNLPYKIFAFLLAISFWFFLVLFQNIIYDLQDPVTIQVLNSPAGIEIANPLPELVVRVTAPKDDTAFLHAEDFTAQIDLSDLKEGVYTIPIHVSTERSNVNIVSYVPREVEVKLEEIETNSFAIRADVVGKPASDYSVGEISYNPRKVTVKAPNSIIDSISYVGHTIELLGTETENVKNLYTLVAYNKDGLPITHSIKITPEKVTTEVELLKEVNEKIVPIVLQYSSDVDVSRIRDSNTTPSTVTIRGNIQDLAAISSIKTIPLTSSDIENIMTGGEYFADLIVPSNTELTNSEPKVTVEIK